MDCDCCTCTSAYWRLEYPIDDYVLPPPQDFMIPDGVRDASLRHDALARRKYVKPFKWFRFNRARKATAK